MQIGGGITLENAAHWLTAGASHIIVTSYLFAPDGTFLPERLTQLAAEIGKENLVIDLSCRRNKNKSERWTVAMNRWQTLTDLHITTENLDHIAQHCDELLIHAADVEGLCKGIDQQLIQTLGNWAETTPQKTPITYAGGAATIADIHLTQESSQGNVDITVGSALDIFGGTGFTLTELTEWNSNI